MRFEKIYFRLMQQSSLKIYFSGNLTKSQCDVNSSGFFATLCFQDEERAKLCRITFRRIICTWPVDHVLLLFTWQLSWRLHSWFFACSWNKVWRVINDFSTATMSIVPQTWWHRLCEICSGKFHWRKLKNIVKKFSNKN